MVLTFLSTLVKRCSSRSSLLSKFGDSWGWLWGFLPIEMKSSAASEAGFESLLVIQNPAKQAKYFPTQLLKHYSQIVLTKCLTS